MDYEDINADTQERDKNCPLSCTRRALLFGSTRPTRSGELGLKYGPSDWRMVGSSPSWHWRYSGSVVSM